MGLELDCDRPEPGRFSDESLTELSLSRRLVRAEKPWGPDNPHPLSTLRTDLVWEGKYDEYGERRLVDIAGQAMPMQRIETVDQPREHMVVLSWHLLPTHLAVDNLDRGTRTEVWLRDLRVGVALPDKVFSLGNLESQGPIPGS